MLQAYLVNRTWWVLKQEHMKLRRNIGGMVGKGRNWKGGNGG